MEERRIFELKIEEDDFVSGIDSISLVDDPAIEVNWLAFKKETLKYIVPDGKDQEHLDILFKGGQSEQELFDEGWAISDVEVVNEHNFGLSPTHPNEESYEDTEERRIRYKYDLSPNIKQSKLIPSSRFYCQTLINRNYVWTREELQNLNPNNDYRDGGFGGDPMIWRGGYNCRHNWFKITYLPEGKIVNKASIKKNRETDAAGRAPDLPTDWIQGNTVTSKTRNNPSPQTVKNLGLSKEKTGFKVESTDKHIVIGPAMVPNMEILRKDDKGEPYWVFFSEETIRMIAEKYMKNGFNVANDINHDGKKVKDAYVVESWIKEDDDDKSKKYGYESLPIGTWFVSMKIKDEGLWSKVKNEELNGFSVSGYFEEVIVEMEKEELFLSELAKILGMRKKVE